MRTTVLVPIQVSYYRQKNHVLQVIPTFMDLSTKITIAGFSLTYLQLTMLLAAVTGIAYRMHLGPFAPKIAY